MAEKKSTGSKSVKMERSEDSSKANARAGHSSKPSSPCIKIAKPGNQGKKPSSDVADLRRLAEERIKKTEDASLPSGEADTRKLLHERQVNQIELEMQNEELHAAQLLLETSRNRYVELYDFAPVGYFTLNAEGIFLEANLTAATLLGVDRGGLIRQPITRFILKDDQDIYYHHRQQLFDTGEPQSCELRLIKKDKSIFWGRLDATAIRRVDGSVGCRVVVSDVTEQNKREKELLKQQQFLQKAQEIGKIGTWELDIGKNELLWTDETYRIFGLPIGTELTYETFLNCVHPEDRKHVDTEWNAALKKKSYDIEHRLVFDGKVKWIREKAEFEFNDKDECIRAIGVAQDITERKRAEEKIKKLNEDLERRIAARTEELSEQNVLLEEKNIALREIMRQLEREKVQVEQRVLDNVDLLLTPLLQNLKDKGSQLDQHYLDLLETNIDRLTSSFARNLTSPKYNLTPREIEVCNFIRSGTRSKDIARLMYLSFGTIENYRKNIRRKLGLANSKINLTNYLKTL